MLVGALEMYSVYKHGTPLRARMNAVVPVPQPYAPIHYYGDVPEGEFGSVYADRQRFRVYNRSMERVPHTSCFVAS